MTEDLPGPPAQPGLTPDVILQLATSFMATRYLIAAVEVWVFEALGGAALDGPGAHVVHYPIDGGRLINFLAVVDQPRQRTAPAWMQPAEPGAHLEAFAGWHPAVTELIGAVPQSPRWALFARRPLARWNKGPVVLLGDAAHAMLPHQGQGANQAVEDTFVLAQELGNCSDVQAALHRYTTRRRVRTRQVQLMSWAAGPRFICPTGRPRSAVTPTWPRCPTRWPGSMAMTY